MQRLVSISIILLSIITAYGQDGTIDISFGSSGLVSIDLVQYGEAYQDAVSDVNGNIIVAGSAYVNDKLKPMIMVLNREGILDTSFNGMGYKFYTIAGVTYESQFNAVALQSDGKILAGGYARYSDGIYGIICRVNTDGSFDITYGEDGIAKLFKSDTYYSAAVQAIKVQPDDKVLYCGTENSDQTGNFSEFVTGRCLMDGSPDNSFGGTGFVNCYFGGASSYANSLLLQPDGKIVVGGRVSGNFALIRYLANGVPDNTFGSWGEVTTSMTNYAYLQDIGILSDGKIVATGYIEMDNPGGCVYDKTRIAVACYNTDGSLNTGFHDDGKVIFTYDNCNDESYTLLVQPDDKFIIGAATGNSSILESFNYMFIRVMPDGARDPEFGINGTLETDMYEAYEFYRYPRALIFQPSGKAVLVGYTNDWDVGNTFFSAMRINTGVDPTDLEHMNWSNEVQSDSSFSTWFNDNLLYVSNAKGEEIQMYIYTVSGSLIYSFKAPTGLSKYTLKHLPKGMYCVVSDDRRALQTLKIIISYSGY